MNSTLNPDEYRVMIGGRKVAGGEIRINQLLAILPEGRQVNLPGEPGIEPAFGLDAVWIAPESTRLATMQGCTVVDPASVVITHLGEVLRYHAHELLTREALKIMLDRVQQFAPTVIEEIKPETIRMGTLHQVLCQLAAEQIPLADLTLALEAILNHSPAIEDVDQLTDAVRVDLGRLVCERFRDREGRLRAITLEPKLDGYIRQTMQDGKLTVTPAALTRLLEASTAAWQDSARREMPLALLIDQQLRRPLKRLLARSARDLGIVAYQEIPNDMIIESVVTLQYDDIIGQDANLRHSDANRQAVNYRRRPDEPNNSRTYSATVGKDHRPVRWMCNDCNRRHTWCWSD